MHVSVPYAYADSGATDQLYSTLADTITLSLVKLSEPYKVVTVC